MKGLTEDYSYLCSRKKKRKSKTCGGCDIQGKSVLLELFLNMDLSPVKYGNCFSLCKVPGDVLKDGELIPGPPPV